MPDESILSVEVNWEDSPPEGFMEMLRGNHSKSLLGKRIKELKNKIKFPIADNI